MKLVDESLQWYVICAKVRQEELALEELRKGGFAAYLPMRRVKKFKRQYRISTDHHEPLMPGYLFLGAGRGVQIDWGRFRDNRAFEHVGRPLRGQQGPLVIPTHELVKVSVDEMNGEFDETGATKRENHSKLEHRFAPGNEFRVVEGPFIGFMAISDEVTPQDRVRALVEIFGRLTPVEFEPAQLEENDTPKRRRRAA